MARYGNSIYQAAYYGASTNQLAGSAEPIYAVSTGYGAVLVTWLEPLGRGTQYTELRLLRNQDAYAETEEDGVVVWSWDYTQVALSTRLEDGVDFTSVPLSAGRYVYYRMWLKKSDETWAPAGEAYTVVPIAHGTTLPTGDSLSTLDKLVDILPRVFTSFSNAPLDEVDKNSTLYAFLSAFSFTLDEFLTLISLLIPDDSGRGTNPGSLMAKANQFGLPIGSMSVTKSQKRTVREAIYTYSRKGTQAALSTWAESVTGFAPTITVSKNLMLSNQDSTFNGGLGNWLSVGNCTITTDNTVYPPTAESGAIDLNYTGKVVALTAGAKIVNGVYSPKTLGIPVKSGVEYDLMYYVKPSTSAASYVVPSVFWYDFNGNLISTAMSTHTDLGVDSNDWSKQSISLEAAPIAARYAAIEFTFTHTGTYHLDQIQFAESTPNPVFEEARAVTIYLAPTSFVANPYPNKQVKIVRLIEELYNVLPNNTPYILLLDDTDAITGFTH